jgi:peptidoglycan/xylan/chitin deacetylase (PgdA/CDA1 family)
MSRNGTFLAFHQTSDRFFPGINNVRPNRFWALLDLLRSWEIGISGGEKASSDSTGDGVTLTFDDGYEDQFELFIRLRREGIRPLVFIPTDYIGLKNSWEYSSRIFPARHLNAYQIRELAGEGVIFGSHGASHRSLAAMSLEKARQELRHSKEILEDITGGPVSRISFPFGRTGAEVNNLARKGGYDEGYVLLDSPEGEGSAGFLRRRLPIYGIDDYYSMRSLLLKKGRLEGLKRRIIGDLSAGTIIVSRTLK